MKTFCFLALCFFSSSTMSAQMNSWPTKVVWLTTTTTNDGEVAQAIKASKGAQFDVFYVDYSQKILEHFENSFPSSMLNKPESERNEYVKKNITPRLKAYTPEMMRSEMGIGLAKLYQLKRIPAVVINDKYITYGLSVDESIALYLKTREDK